MKRSIFLLILVGLVSLTAVFGWGNNGPLFVTYHEKYNITANTTGEGVINIKNITVTGYLIINNTGDTANDTLLDVWIAINVSNNESGLEPINPYNINYSIYNKAPSYTDLPSNLTYIHIPTLPNNTYLEFKININESKVGVPLIINENYDAIKIPARKCVNWTVTLNISRNISALPNTNTIVYVNITKYLSNISKYYGDSCWNFLNITNAIPSQGVVVLWNGPYFTGNTNDSLNWTGIILNSTQNATINITIQGNYTYANRTDILAQYGFAIIFFQYSGTKSGTGVCSAYASGLISISAFKEGPIKNITSGEYNIWYEQGNITNKATKYYFNITNLTIWAANISALDLASYNINPFNIISGSEHSLSSILLSPRESWNTTKYEFIFDDVPVVWANCSFRVVNSNITVLNESDNEYSPEFGSSYIIVEKIYVIGSYLLKVTKHVIPKGSGTYEVYIVVENIGSQKTPDYVYVYDMIPYNFTISDIWVNQSSMLAQHYNNNPSINYTGFTAVSAGIYNVSYYWALHSLYPSANGDGYWNASEIQNNQTVVIHYTLNGTGKFSPSDVFIVGIDPRNSLLPTTSPKITAVSGVIENNYEPLLALLTTIVGLGTIIRLKKYAL
ncbi:conserved exported protein of unknown function [Methanocaldococcus lauensis]|nr:conserved exported protein of unknown function [Methanocaldococcus lauensis]